MSSSGGENTTFSVVVVESLSTGVCVSLPSKCIKTATTTATTNATAATTATATRDEVIGKVADASFIGSVQDRVLVFGHGLDPTKLDMDRDEYVGLVGSACLDSDVSFISYSARGHGSSKGWQSCDDDSQFLWGNLAKDMKKVANHHSYSRFIVGGHSMGAATALYCALQNPDQVEAIVLVRPPTAWETRIARKSLLLSWANNVKKKEEASYQKAIKLFSSTSSSDLASSSSFSSSSSSSSSPSSSPPSLLSSSSSSSAAAAAATPDLLSPDPPCLYRVLNGAAETDLPPRSLRSNASKEHVFADSSNNTFEKGRTTNSDAPLSSHPEICWGDITCPVLILAYKNDDAHPISTSEYLLELIPHAELHIMEGEADAKESWKPIIESFLKKHF